MPTTPGGLPYPLPTEPVAEGAANIRALAEAVDTGLPFAIATFTRTVDATVGAEVAANVTSGNFGATTPIVTGRSIILFGTLRFRQQVAPGNVFVDVRMDGATLGTVTIGGITVSAYDQVVTVVGVGIAVAPHPSVQLTARTSAGTLLVRPDSRIIAVGGFKAYV